MPKGRKVTLLDLVMDEEKERVRELARQADSKLELDCKDARGLSAFMAAARGNGYGGDSFKEILSALWEAYKRILPKRDQEFLLLETSKIGHVEWNLFMHAAKCGDIDNLKLVVSFYKGTFGTSWKEVIEDTIDLANVDTKVRGYVKQELGVETISNYGGTQRTRSSTSAKSRRGFSDKLNARKHAPTKRGHEASEKPDVHEKSRITQAAKKQKKQRKNDTGEHSDASARQQKSKARGDTDSDEVEVVLRSNDESAREVYDLVTSSDDDEAAAVKQAGGRQIKKDGVQDPEEAMRVWLAQKCPFLDYASINEYAAKLSELGVSPQDGARPNSQLQLDDLDFIKPILHRREVLEQVSGKKPCSRG